MTKPWEERFWARVDKGDGPGCWTWTGRVGRQGYGMFDIQFPGMDRERPRHAHRVAWFILTGDVLPTDRDLCHSCDNRQCVRPDHLFVGTRSDNMRDCAEKRRLGATKKANAAALMRKAAPDLYRALEALQANVQAMLGGAPLKATLLGDAERALRKARGET